jgi:hypothetical protein
MTGMETTCNAPESTVAGAAAITHVAATTTGVSVAASAAYRPGIGRVDFLVVDLTSATVSDVVARKDADLAGSPSRVTDAWSSSVPLKSGTAYRLFFHVYDRSGVNLVAYDRRDFTCSEPNPKEDRDENART